MNLWDLISKKLEDLPPGSKGQPGYLKVNAHIHTPYSYSSFDSIDSIIKAARKENISVLGINDFNTVNGFDEWADKCYNAGIFPLFNIEMIGLGRSDLEAGRRVNDPNNPGRTYISGKALTYPMKISGDRLKKIEHIKNLSNEHVYKMTIKVNDILGGINSKMIIDFDKMIHDHTRGMARERHLASMIRYEIESNYLPGNKRDEIYLKLLGNSFLNIDQGDHAQIENLIRSKLLKSGGAAFVEEDTEIFIEPREIHDLILDAGGIPTYPFLADFNNGLYTDFEKDRDKAASSLMERGFFSTEFIPSRNDFHRLRDYVMYLYDRGFLITFGTEHNSPGTKPLEVKAAGDHELDDDLIGINFEGACILTAHQYKSAIEGQGYLDEEGRPKTGERLEFISLGNKIIKTVCS
jgi:hypothetical protein